MSHRNVLCLAIDGLRPDALGAYGDPSGITPGLDRLAAEACLFDFAFCESPELASFYRAAWRGEHPLRSQNDGKPFGSMIHAASRAGYRTGLITDDPCLVELAADEGFSNVIEVPCSEAAIETSDHEDSDAAEIVAEAVNWILENGQTSTGKKVSGTFCRNGPGKKVSGTFCRNGPEGALHKRFLTPFSRQPWLLWVHFGGLTHAWETTDISADRYTARLESLDLDVDMLQHTLSTHGQLDRALILLIGCRGFPLGEHGEYALATRSLFEELSHVPLLLGAPEDSGALGRVKGLVCAADVAATLAAWCHISEDEWLTEDGRSLLTQMRGNDVPWREALLLTNQEGEIGVRTDDWYLRAPNADNRAESPHVELYSKPDDRWDTNEISSLCEQVVMELLARKAHLESGLNS